MNRKFSSQLFEEWSQRAEEDIFMANMALAKKGPLNQVCFHSQQAAEKYLKGYIMAHGQLPEKTHQLPYLVDLCSGLNPSFKLLEKEASYLTLFYIGTRYPGHTEKLSREIAKKTLVAAIKIKNFVITATKRSL